MLKEKPMTQGVIVSVNDAQNQVEYTAINREYVDTILSLGQIFVDECAKCLDQKEVKHIKRNETSYMTKKWVQEKQYHVANYIAQSQRLIEKCKAYGPILTYKNTLYDPSLKTKLNKIIEYYRIFVTERSWSGNLRQLTHNIEFNKFSKLECIRFPSLTYRNELIVTSFLTDLTPGIGVITNKFVIPNRLMCKQYNFRELELQSLSQEHHDAIKSWLRELIDAKIIVFFDVETSIEEILDSWMPCITGLNINKKISGSLAKRILMKGIV